jgi:hypothetical protein
MMMVHWKFGFVCSARQTGGSLRPHFIYDFKQTPIVQNSRCPTLYPTLFSILIFEYLNFKFSTNASCECGPLV